MIYYKMDQDKMETEKQISEGCWVGLCHADIPYGFTLKKTEDCLHINIDYLIASEEEKIHRVSDNRTAIFFLGRYSNRLLGLSLSCSNESSSPYRKNPRAVLQQLEAVLDELHDKEKREGSKMNYKAVKEGLELGEVLFPAWFAEYVSR